MADDESRDNKGRWLPGQSGNPHGSTKSVNELRAMLASGAPDVVASVLFFAANGDMAAARLVLERVIPALRASSGLAEIPELASGDLMSRANSVLTSIASGRLTTDQGEQLLKALAAVVQITELAEMKTRLAALESKDLL